MQQDIITNQIARNQISPLRTDPSRTLSLRRQWIADLNRRFRKLNKEIQKLIAEEDAFGLIESKGVFNDERQRWRFLTDDEKLTSFNRWFRRQVNSGVLSVSNDGVQSQPWTATYVESAYRKGALRAYTDTRKEALAAKADFYEGSRAEFLRASFGGPETVSKIRLLATRSFEQLRGVTETMASQMNTLLAEGLSHGRGALQIAKDLRRRVTALSRSRANMIARTEVIYAHAEGQLDSFEALGVEEVGIMAEWLTAGDDRVCAQCSIAAEQGPYTVKDARGMMPLHPNCRCTWTPSV